MTFDEFNIELGTVLYLDDITEREQIESENQTLAADGAAEYARERQKIMGSFLSFAGLPADEAAIKKALAALHEGLSDGERTTLLTIRNLNNRQQAGHFTEDDADELEDAVEAAEAYLMNRLADILE